MREKKRWPLIMGLVLWLFVLVGCAAPGRTEPPEQEEQDEQEEERYRKLDAAIRELHSKKVKVGKKKESHKIFAKKEATT